MYKIGII